MEYCFLLDLSFVLLVLLPWSVSGTFTVIGPQQPIIALVDGEAIFTCHLSPQTDAQYMDVMWFYGQDGYLVHRYKYRQDYLKHQHKNYKGRTEFLRDDISNGNVALKLRHIRFSDEGKYRCFFESPDDYGKAEFQVFVAEKFTVIGPQQPIIALLGGEATLPCHLSPQMDAQNMNVMWFYGQFSNLVHQYKNSQDNLIHQHREYKGRTEFLRDDISNGSVALKLRHIRLSDEGKYQCSFESPYVYEEAEFQVYVAGKGSTPHIHIENDGNKELRLVCTSTGWYPEPEVQWRKNQEESLSQDTKTMKDENGLFSIETSITASSDSKVNVSCFIWNHLLNQRLEASVSLPDALSPNVPPWMVIVPVVLISTGFIIFIVIWSLKKSKGMCKDKSGIAKVESSMGESVTDSLLQPSAESNVATSVSKNATGVSKDATSVSKDTIGVKKETTVEKREATSVIKHELVEKKEATSVIKHEPGLALPARFWGLGELPRPQGPAWNRSLHHLECTELGVIKHEPVEKKEAIGLALPARFGGLGELPRPQGPAWNCHRSLHHLECTELGVIKHEPGLVPPARFGSLDELPRSQVPAWNCHRSPHHLERTELAQRKDATGVIKAAPMENIEAYGVIKHDPGVKKEATARFGGLDELPHPQGPAWNCHRSPHHLESTKLVQRKDATGVIKHEPVEKKEVNSVIKHEPGENIEAYGVIKHEPVVIKKATARFGGLDELPHPQGPAWNCHRSPHHLESTKLMQRKDATGVIKHEPGVIKHEPGENIEAYGVIKHEPVVIKKATGLVPPARFGGLGGLSCPQVPAWNCHRNPHHLERTELGVIKHEPGVIKAAPMQRKDANDDCEFFRKYKA